MTQMSNRRIDSGILGPAANQAVVNGVPRQPGDARPFGERARLAVDRNPSRVASVVGLLCASGPAAVLGRVRAVIVDALYRAARWPRPHIQHKLLKRLPPLRTHHNATPAVVGVAIDFGVVAPGDHGLPCAVFRGHGRFAERMHLRPPYLDAVADSHFAAKTAATAGVRIDQAGRLDACQVSAVAQARPHSPATAVISRPTHHRKPAESHASKVTSAALFRLFCFHTLNCN